MAKISASNAVLQAIETACAIYGVRCYRMNSRAIQVIGAGGRERPMFFGQWRDQSGIQHKRGMADLLLTPRIRLQTSPPTRVCVPLWVECKSGTGELRADQILFRDDVIDSGAFYIEAHDSADAVIQWFNEQGVSK
jgi:hypothetical protein